MRQCARSALAVLSISIVFVLLLVSSTLEAQEYRGTILGRVVDSSGAVIPNAVIRATGPQQVYTAKTAANGDYIIPFVQPGSYSVSAEAPNFKKTIHQGVVVDVSQKINLNLTLEVGAISETVSVTANNSVGLNTADASGGTVMDPEKVQSLPLNGRQLYMMLNLTPGTKFNQTQFGPGGYSGTRGWDESNAYSINGQSGNYNQFTLNGAPISQQGGGGSGTWNIAPNVDAVDEFKVMTNTYDAQYGRQTGGTVNTVLKSGTDKFHGTVFDFWRNSVLDANTYQLNQQGTSKPFHNQHQFGGTVGGPIWKNKAFFFFSFEGWREVLPVGVQTTTLTADMRPGSGPGGGVDLNNYVNAMGLNGIYDPATTRCVDSSCNDYIRDQFPGNVIPASRITPIAANIMKIYPSPNRSGYVGNYVATDPGSYRYNQPIARIDYNFTDSTRMYGMFAWWSGREYRNGSGLPGPAAQGDIDNYRSSLTQVIDVTHTFSPRLFLDTRVSFNRAFNQDPNGRVAAGLDKLNASDLGLAMPAVPTTNHQYAPEIDMDDPYLANVIGNSIGTHTIYETYDLNPSLTHVIGRHNLHYGADFMLFHDVPTGIGQPNGNFWFGTDFTQQNPRQGNNDGAAVADLLLGYPENCCNSSRVQYWESVYESYNYYAAFVQDDWKIRHNLTVNLGLRWETESSPRERNNRLTAGFCLTCTNPISSQINYSVFPGNVLPNGASISNPLVGGPQFASGKFSAYENYLGSFLPKIGVSLGLNDKLVMRGGWGMASALGIELGAQSTWEQDTAYNTSTDGGLTPTDYFRNGSPYPNGITTPPGNSQGLASGVGDGYSFDQRNRKIPISQQYSFGFQGAGPLQMIWDLEYVGAHTTKLRAPMQLNGLSPADFAKGHDNHSYLDQQVPNPFYGVLPSTTGLGQNQTVQAKVLMVPFPQFNGSVYDYTVPTGYSNYNSLIAKLEKRVSGTGALSRGLSFLTSFTWSKIMSAQNRLNNSGEGLVDPKPYYAVGTSDRPWDFAFSGLYGLPIGRGGAILPNAHGLLGQVVNEWQLDWIFSNDGGQPIGDTQGGGNALPNKYLYGCGNYNLLPSHRTWSSYLNNSNPSCFSTFPEYTAVTQLPITTQLRKPWSQQTQLALQKKFDLYENVKLQFKAEAFNLTNTVIFGGPSMGNPNRAITRNSNVADPNQPGAWSGYGTIGSTQQNFPRQLQLSLKVLF